MPSCDLIIPALNEASNIPALFDALQPLRDSGLVGTVVFADNGSTDGGDRLAAERGAIVVHELHRGYGAACLKAIDWIAQQERQPDIVAFLDADLSDDPTALPILLTPIETGEAAMVIGSRIRYATPGSLNFVQRFGNGLACALMQLATGRRYRDLGPFRAIRWETLQRLRMADRTWGWTVEMQMRAALLRIPTIDMDVPYRKRHSGKSKISGTVRGVVTAGSKIIFTIAALWWQRRRIQRDYADGASC